MLDLTGDGARELQRSCSTHLTLLQVDITQPQQVQQALLDTKVKLGLRGKQSSGSGGVGWSCLFQENLCTSLSDTMKT